VLHYTKLERLARDKHSGLLGQPVSYEENEVLWIWPRNLYSQHFISFVTYEWAQYKLLHYIKLERLAGDKLFELLGKLVSWKENEMLWIWPQEHCSQHLIIS
jgi:hypothetical protein